MSLLYLNLWEICTRGVERVAKKLKEHHVQNFEPLKLGNKIFTANTQVCMKTSISCEKILKLAKKIVKIGKRIKVGMKENER